MVQHLREILNQAEVLRDDMVMFLHGASGKTAGEIVEDWIKFCMDYDPYGFNQDPLTPEDGLYYLLNDTDETIRNMEYIIDEIRGDLEFRMSPYEEE